METESVRKISNRQIFYLTAAILGSILLIYITEACWKIHTIRQAEEYGLFLEGTRDHSDEGKVQRFDSLLGSIGIPDLSRAQIATSLYNLAWETNWIVVEKDMSPKLASILSSREFKDIEALSFAHAKVDLQNLAASGPKPKCRFLDLEHGKLDDSCISVIVENFPQVELINFRGVPLGGSNFAAFSNHQGKSLGLNLNNSIWYTREDLEALATACPQLGYLRINMISDETFEPLLQCLNLWGLDLNGSTIRGDIVKQFHNLPELKWLCIGSNHSKKRDLDIMLSSPPIPTVERLNLKGLKIEERHIPQIARVFPNVKELWLPYCTLSPNAIADLSQLSSLRTLNLNDIKLKEGRPTIPIQLPITSLWIDGKEKASLLKIYPSLSPLISRNSAEWIDAYDPSYFEEIGMDY